MKFRNKATREIIKLERRKDNLVGFTCNYVSGFKVGDSISIRIMSPQNRIIESKIKNIVGSEMIIDNPDGNEYIASLMKIEYDGFNELRISPKDSAPWFAFIKVENEE